MPHGKTLLMRNIRRPAPRWFVQHAATAGWDRRHFLTLPNRAVVNVPKLARPPASNVPHRTPDCDGTSSCLARDHTTGCELHTLRRGRKARLGRRLRKELV